MGGSILSIGVSGLLANQRALQTTSNNVSNANTDGYSRQRIEFSSRPPMFLGGGYVGTGVQTQAVERIYDGFLNDQVSVYTSSASSSAAYTRLASSVDELMADPEVGMMPAMDNYFSALNDVANDPSAIPPRQALISQMESLADRFQYVDQRLSGLRSQVNSQVNDFVSEINSLAQGIALINKNIASSPSGGGAPNDLLDERDRLLGKLSEKVSVSTVEQGDGSMNVFIGNGQSLVVGFNANSLELKPNRFDVTQQEVGLNVGGGTSIEITKQIKGGALGGILEFRSGLLDSAQNEIGKLAMGMAQAANDQHRLGQNLNGNLGGDLFNLADLDVLPGAGVADVVTATLGDVNDLTGSDYVLNYDGANYTLTRSSDQQVTALSATGGTVDGFNINIGAGMVAGDQVMIRPTRNGGRDIASLLKDPRDIAAAQSVISQTGLTNAGNASISSGNVVDASGLPLPNGVSLSFDAAGNQFIATGAVPPAGPFPYTSGDTFNVNGLEFEISGVPADGDQFIIDNNSGGVSDNRNMLGLVELQMASVMENGSSTYQDVYGQLVAEVGIKTNQAVIAEKAQTNLLEQASKAQQSYSGVNLDEEAANLMKFQQAYQASAQVITAATAMFDTLLNAVRR